MCTCDVIDKGLSYRHRGTFREDCMTLVEKILAAHTGRESVRAGEFVNVRADLVMASNITAHIAAGQFKKTGGQEGLRYTER
jgi:homoaconitase/3-isopropylmalate dehydratase large subunit